MSAMPKRGNYQKGTDTLRLKSAVEFFTDYNKEFLSYSGYKDSAEKAAECEKYQTYFEGRDLFLGGDYTKAIEKLEAADVLESDALCDYIRAVILFESGDTEKELEIAAECAQEAYMALPMGYNRDKYEEILSTVASNNPVNIGEYSGHMDVLVGFIGDENSSLARTLQEYWSSPADIGLNPAKLEVLPLTSKLETLVRLAYNNYQSSIRRGNMSSIIAEQELDKYYDKGKAPPVEITGNSFYENAVRNKDSWEICSFGFFPKAISDQPGYEYFIADKPENARYLFYSTVSHRHDASWEYKSSGVYAGESYHTTARVIIKDLKTGKVLFKPQGFRKAFI